MVRLVLFLIASVAYGQIDLTKQTKSTCAAGRVFFAGASGQVQCDGSIVWDNTNKRLGIGTATPESFLDVRVINFNDTPHFMRTTPVTNTLVTTLRLRKHVLGTAADGVGPSITFLLSDNDNVVNTLGQFGFVRAGSDSMGTITARYNDNSVAFNFPHTSVGGAQIFNSLDINNILRINATSNEPGIRLTRTAAPPDQRIFHIHSTTTGEVWFSFVNDTNTNFVSAIRIVRGTGNTVAKIIISSGTLAITNVPTFADNAAALAAGKVVGDVYRTSDGTLKVVF